MSAELLVGLIIGLPVGLAAGAGIAWVVCSSQAAARTDAAVALEGQRAAVAEALVEETRNLLLTAKAETESGREIVKKIQTNYVAAKTRLDQTEKNLKEQKELVETAKFKLTETFDALAARALAQNNRGFLVLAEEKFKGIRSDAAADLDARRSAIDALVKPIGDTLHTFQKETKELEARRLTELGSVGERLRSDAATDFDARRSAIDALVKPLGETLNAFHTETKELEAKRLMEIGSVSERLRSVAETQNLLYKETAKLVNALKSPQVRGRWGEIVLRRTAELAGMTLHCDFVEQVSVPTDTGLLRPDMIVKLPAGRDVVVDSKVSCDAFMRHLEAHTEEERNAALPDHAKQVAQHVSRLSAKEYWGQFQPGPEFVVLFIPNDSFLAAAAEKDPTLIESAVAKKIIIATPTTFIALLLAIEVGWRQHMAIENAERIRNLGQDLSDRVATLVEHLNKLGSGLGKAVESYNAAVGSFEGMLLPAARRFKELGAGGRKVVEELLPMDKPLRQVLVSDPASSKESPAENATPRLFE